MSKRTIWNYNGADYDNMKREFLENDWSLWHDDDINVYSNNVTNFIHDTCKRFIPSQLVNTNVSDPSWFKTEIKRKIRQGKRT